MFGDYITKLNTYLNEYLDHNMLAQRMKDMMAEEVLKTSEDTSENNETDFRYKFKGYDT